MKRVIIILSCVLLLAAVTLTSVFATAGSASLTASSSTVEAGDTVTVTLSVSGYGSVEMLGVTDFAAPDGMQLVSGEWLLPDGTIEEVNLNGLEAIYFDMDAHVDLSQQIDLIRFTYKANEPAVGAQDLEKTIAMNLILRSDAGQVVPVSAKVTVVKSAASLSLPGSVTIDLSVTAEQQLTATYGPENTTQKLTWSSDNGQVAAVDASGKVTGLAKGTANITAAIGSLSKTCQVTVTCSHPTKTEHEAVEPTCKNTGNNKYYTCDTCSAVFKADGTTETTLDAETLATVGHKGGTATCSAKAVCQWCSQPYGDTLPHTFTEKIEDDAHLVPGSGADCQSVKQYYYDCANCSAISDTKTFDSTTRGNHKMDANWTAVNGQHYRKCTVNGCTHKTDVGTCSGGTATCQVLATCDTCSNPYGQLAECNFTAQNTELKYRKSPATCTELAVYHYSCTVCGKKDNGRTFTSGALDPTNHAKGTELRGVVAANCYQQGYSGDTYCKAVGCQIQLATGTVVPATGNHVAGTKWFSDGDRHWHICTTTGCGAKVNEAAHTFTWKLDEAATEDKTGLKHRECACGVKRDEGTVIEKLDHVHVGIKHVAAVKATCTKAGTVEYWTCSSSKCAGKYYGDNQCQLLLETIAEPINKDNHTGGTTVKNAADATCSANGYSGDTYCNSCTKLIKKGEAIAATGKHTPKDGYENDDEQHWQICVHCGQIVDYRKEDHTYTWVVDQYPTESAAGSKHQSCTVCGHISGEGTVIDQLVHSPTLVSGKEPTCTEDGVLEHYMCGNCGGYYASVDGQAGDAITQEETVLKATGHSFGTQWLTSETEHWHDCACGATAEKAAHTTEVVGAKDATETETGYTGDTVCSVCGYVVAEGEEIPVLETQAPTEPADAPAEAPEPEKSGVNPAVWIASSVGVAAAAATGVFLGLRKRRK